MQVVIHFFSHSFAENWGHWLIGHSAANEFWWQTSPQRRKLVPSQLRLAECSSYDLLAQLCLLW